MQTEIWQQKIRFKLQNTPSISSLRVGILCYLAFSIMVFIELICGNIDNIGIEAWLYRPPYPLRNAKIAVDLG